MTITRHRSVIETEQGVGKEIKMVDANIYVSSALTRLHVKRRL